MIFLTLVAAMTVGACSSAQSNDLATGAIAGALRAHSLPESAKQVVVVSADRDGCTAASLAVYERSPEGWRATLTPVRAVLGRNGFAAPGTKREGDGKTPTGAFAIASAFGYAPTSTSTLPYRQATADDVWVDDAKAADYNRWVKRSETWATSFESMKRNDDLYEYGLVIAYNTSPVQAGAGSAIFIHVWRAADKPTAGCVALEKSVVQRLHASLTPDAFVLMGTTASLKAIAASP